MRRPAAIAVAIAALAALAVGLARARAAAQAVEVKVPKTRVCIRQVNGIELGVRSRGARRRFRARLYDPHGKVVLDHRGLATSRWKRWGYRPLLGGTYRTVYTLPGRTRRYRTAAVGCG
ncbi:MAG TPA: hypothetical protein VE596_12615 [Gaiellaceae bacterium]|jgi:hypothetical protein|nr:hypothetical protein [Gaiellaceae bacterium]